ncbi:MAG: PAS-domain containing protein [Sphingobacteriales bacterium]
MQRATGLHDVGRQVVHVHVAQSLLDYRICNGSFTRDPVEYRRDLVGTMAAGKTTSTEVKSADGRSISVINRPMAGGSWAATHRAPRCGARESLNAGAAATPHHHRASDFCFPSAGRRSPEDRG